MPALYLICTRRARISGVFLKINPKNVPFLVKNLSRIENYSFMFRMELTPYMDKCGIFL